MTFASPPLNGVNALTPSRPHALTPSHALRAIPLPASHACLLTRQYHSTFNQPLSFDTSKVTTMHRMFYVRSARALTPTVLNRSLPIKSRLRTRQEAKTFNQPLSFNTTSVTTMHQMFRVRAHQMFRVPWSPSLDSGHPRACRFASYPRLSTLGRARRSSTSRSGSTRPRSRTWAPCSTCAPRVPRAPQP